MSKNLKTTFKAWPVIAAITIGLCFLTQRVASLLGVELPDQQNVEVVRQWLTHAFDSVNNFRTCAFLLAQVLVLLPALEETIFRLPTRWLRGKPWWVLSSVLFSAAHYIMQPFPDAAFIALFFFGLAQCWLYKKTGRLWCPILNHCLFNLTNVVLVLIIPK
jgi:membrane protease YdiL (CAAX protease family)